MTAFLLRPRRNFVVWLVAFVSPTGYFLLLMLGDRLGLASPPDGLAAALFYGLPLVALAVGGWAVWASDLPKPHKVAWLFFTVVGIAVQFGALVLLIIAVTVAISMP